MQRSALLPELTFRGELGLVDFHFYPYCFTHFHFLENSYYHIQAFKAPLPNLF